MASIGGPGGIGGPKGPSGPDGPDDIDDVGDVAPEAAVDRADAARVATEIDALAADVAAGKLTAREAIDRLADSMASEDMDATERAELKELLTDLVANDPYLGGLANRV